MTSEVAKMEFKKEDKINILEGLIHTSLEGAELFGIQKGLDFAHGYFQGKFQSQPLVIGNVAIFMQGIVCQDDFLSVIRLC